MNLSRTTNIYYKLLLFLGVFVGVLFLGKVDVSAASTWDTYGFTVEGSGSAWTEVSGYGSETLLNKSNAFNDKVEVTDIYGNFVCYDTYGELITEEKVSETADDITVKFKYYLYHKGKSEQT